MSPPSAPAPKSPPRADTRYIPLQLTHLARNLKYHDPGMYVAIHARRYIAEALTILIIIERCVCVRLLENVTRT